MDQELTELEVTEKLADYFQNQTIQCFKPHCKPNKQMSKYNASINFQPIDSQGLSDCENDTRRKVSDPLEFPYSAIGCLSLKYGQKKYRASGFLVGPNIVLTAARNLYIHSLQKECEQVRFYPGLHSLTGQRCYVQRFYYPPQYKLITPDKRGQYDFAILVLNEDIGLEYGYLGVDFGEKKEKWLSENVHIYGYPQCIFEDKKQLDTLYCMYGDSGKWVKQNENRLTYSIPTSAGQCGSPIFIKEAQDSYTVVGIHTNDEICSNSGVLMNTKVKERIYQWIKQRQEVLREIIQMLRMAKKLKKELYEQSMKNIQEKKIQQEFLGNKKIYSDNNSIQEEGEDFVSLANCPSQTANSLRQKNICLQEEKFLNKDNWPRLSQISLSNTNKYIDNDNIGAEEGELVNKDNWPRLSQISLNNNNIGAEGVEFLSGANCPFLTAITLNNNNIGTKGVEFLSRARCPLLTQINLSNNNIGAEGVELINEAGWRYLTQINIDNNNVGAEGMKFLIQAQYPLTSISLNYNNIGVRGAKFLSQASWPQLRHIYLGDNNIGGEGAKFLSQANWPQLNAIYLYYNKIDAEGAKFLSQANWPRLFKIYLYNNNIGIEGAKFLSQAYWPMLAEIYLGNNNIGAYGQKFLKSVQWSARSNFSIQF